MEKFSYFKGENDGEKQNNKDHFEEISKDLNFDTNQEDSLIEDRRTSKIIGNNYMELNQLDDLNQKGVNLQYDQNIYLDNLKKDLENREYTIQEDLVFLKNLKDFKNKLIDLKTQIKDMSTALKLYENGTDVSVKSQNLTKEYFHTVEQIKRMEEDIENNNISPENLLELQKEYEALEEKYNFLEKTWFPEHPLNN